MKAGDLVKRKWVTFATMRRQKALGMPVDGLGLVLRVTDEYAEVLFPSQGGKTHKFLHERLEIICHSGGNNENR